MTTKATQPFENYNTDIPCDDQYLNILKQEMNNLIGIDGSSIDGTGNINNQQADSVKSYVSQAGILCTDTSSGANVYVVNASTPFTNPVLKTGTRIRFKTANANTGSSTIAAFGGSAVTCKKSDGSTNLSASDIPANSEVEFVYNGTNWVKTSYGLATTTNRGVSYLNTPITVANSVSSPNDTIDFGPGTYITSSGQQVYIPTMTKKIQSSGSWTAGTGQNGLDTGARSSNKFYRTYVIQNNSSLAYDILFAESGSSPVVPSGYTNLNIVDYAFIRVNGSNNIANAKWDVMNKELTLGAYEFIQVFSSTAGSGNAVILNTTEPLKFKVRGYLSTTTTGASDLYVYGSESTANDGGDGGMLIATNNGFQAAGSGEVDTSDGKIYWKNFSTAGGISSQICKIKSIKIRS